MIRRGSKTLGDFLLIANGLLFVVVVNMLASLYFFRLDLTEEKRYTVKQATRSLLKSLDDKVYVEVFLEGNLNAGFKRLQRSIRELLEEFRMLSGGRVDYSFTHPTLARSRAAQGEFIRYLASKGIEPINVIENKNDERAEKLVFPGALISYNGSEVGVMVLQGSRAGGSEETLNQSIEELEFKLATAVYQLVHTERKRVGVLTGHGESDSVEVVDFNRALLALYDVFTVDLTRDEVMGNYDVLIITKPKKEFSERDRWKLDQYIMHGGRVLFLLDRVDAVMDSASREDYYAFPYRLNLDDLLFRYGVRVNADLVQDKVSSWYPVVVGQVGDKPQLRNVRWPFFPLITHYSDHVITKNLDASRFRFAGSIDTVKATGIRKTPLLFSSPFSRKIRAPIRIQAAALEAEKNPDVFTDGSVPMGYLLEGQFMSLYTNRFLPAESDTVSFREKSVSTKIIVLSDGDVARNDIHLRTGNPYPLGYDPVSSYTFANRNLLLNAVAYLMDASGLIRARSKEFKIRPLNKVKVQGDRVFWQSVNMGLPLFILFGYGVCRVYVRKRKYSRH